MCLTPSHRLLSTAIVLGCVSAVSCQFDKLIAPPDDPLPPVVSLVHIDESAAVGSHATRSIEMSLTNPGDYTISWTALISGESPWITIDRSADTAPAQLTVSLRPEDLNIGPHADTIVIARSDRPDVYISVPVDFAILPCEIVNIVGDSELTDEIGDDDCEAPHRENHFSKLYRVLGQPEDSVSVMLESTAFDAFIILATYNDPTQEPLLERASCDDHPAQACIGYVSLADADPLYIEVMSETPMQGGPFTLHVNAPRVPSVPSTLGQFADLQGTPIPEGGTIPNNEMFVEGTLFDVDPMDSVRLEIEVRTTATAFTFVPTHSSDMVPRGESPAIHVMGLLDDTDYKWHARTVDLSGRQSDWVTFGAGGDEPDFQVRVADAPHPPPYLGQLQSDASTPVPAGSRIDEQTIVLEGMVVDNDENEMVRLEVEVRPAGTPFQNVPTGSSVLVSSGDTASIVVGGLGDGIDYEWQARAVDQDGLQGPWAAFGDSHTATFDFGVSIPADHLVIIGQPTGGTAGRQLSELRVEARKPSGLVDENFVGAVLVDLTPGTGAPGAVLSGTVLVVAAQGVAVFDDLSIDLAGANYRLTILTAGLPPILTAPFTIRNPLPVELVIVTQPSGRAESGRMFARQPILEFRDEAGHPVPLTGLQVTATLASGPLGELNGTTTMAAAANGRVTFTDLAIKGEAGTYTIAFADPTGRVAQVVSAPIRVVTATDIGPDLPNSNATFDMMGRHDGKECTRAVCRPRRGQTGATSDHRAGNNNRKSRTSVVESATSHRDVVQTRVARTEDS